MSYATLVLVLALADRAVALGPTAAEMATAARFAGDKLLAADPAALPFSFVYGGRLSAELLKTWKRSVSVDGARRTVTYVDPRTGLEVRCQAVEYRDYPVVEWTLWFRNTSSVDSPILEQVQALDTNWQRSASGEFLLHHATGSPATRWDYAPRETVLPPTATKRLGGSGGRPTNADWAYFNLQWDREGAIVAVGWPGQWAGQFTRDAGRSVHLAVGQETFRARLAPGEEIRSPLVVLLFWQGEPLRAQNLWRRWMMVHSMPKPGGRLPPPQWVASSSRAYKEMIEANEQNQIMHIDRHVEERTETGLPGGWTPAGTFSSEAGRRWAPGKSIPSGFPAGCARSATMPTRAG